MALGFYIYYFKGHNRYWDFHWFLNYYKCIKNHGIMILINFIYHLMTISCKEMSTLLLFGNPLYCCWLTCSDVTPPSWSESKVIPLWLSGVFASMNEYTEKKETLKKEIEFERQTLHWRQKGKRYFFSICTSAIKRQIYWGWSEVRQECSLPVRSSLVIGQDQFLRGSKNPKWARRAETASHEFSLSALFGYFWVCSRSWWRYKFISGVHGRLQRMSPGLQS